LPVIDSDYQVEPYWLRRALPFFASPKVALVQGPQDYRDGSRKRIPRRCASRNIAASSISAWWSETEHDAIIQHGTMTIVRRDVLESVGRMERLVHHRGYRTRAQTL